MCLLCHVNSLSRPTRVASRSPPRSQTRCCSTCWSKILPTPHRLCGDENAKQTIRHLPIHYFLRGQFGTCSTSFFISDLHSKNGRVPVFLWLHSSGASLWRGADTNKEKVVKVVWSSFFSVTSSEFANIRTGPRNVFCLVN